MTTKITTWAEAFAPVMKQGREIREGQAQLGQAVMDAVRDQTHLVGEAATGTGKSFATLVPLMVAIREAKKDKKSFRAVVSTETLTLQDQLVEKDLPFLSKLYPDVYYRKLMGRSNYLCLNMATQNTVADLSLHHMVEKLKMRITNLRDGERKDVERVLGKEISDEQWQKMASSATYCADNQCSGEECFSTRARSKALTADLVVVNHAILATDVEMKAGGGSLPGDGLLGRVNALVVDEGHQLQPVLVDQWTKEITERDMNTQIASIMDGIQHLMNIDNNPTLNYSMDLAGDAIQDTLSNIKNFFSLLEEQGGGEWKDSSNALSLKYPVGFPPHALARAMEEFETENPKRLAMAERTLEEVVKFFQKNLPRAREEKIKGLRKINKGNRATIDLLETVKIMSKALETDDGIIQQYGTFGALVDGWVRRDGTYGMTIRLVPLDVSARAKAIWANVKTSILLSATLTDLTDGSFKYAKACVGFPPAKELRVSTPFRMSEQQLVYITNTQYPRVDGTQYSFEELMMLLNASDGRALVLFTSRKELDWASEELRKRQAYGQFPHKIYVQDKNSNKAKLMESFKADTHSVLLATKSFFVGIDVPGESLSLVALAKYPLPRYSAECKQQIKYWKERGFPRWYERESLTVFQQASGRLIRSSGCKGVVALLDFRANDGTSSVFKTASIGVKALGSPVTQRIDQVQAFLS